MRRKKKKLADACECNRLDKREHPGELLKLTGTSRLSPAQAANKRAPQKQMVRRQIGLYDGRTEVSQRCRISDIALTGRQGDFLACSAAGKSLGIFETIDTACAAISARVRIAGGGVA